MPVLTLPTLRAATVGVAALGLCLAASPALALASEIVPTAEAAEKVEPVTGTVADPSPSPTGAPLVPEPLQPVVDAVTKKVQEVVPLPSPAGPAASPAAPSPAPAPVSGRASGTAAAGAPAPEPARSKRTGSGSASPDSVSGGTSEPASGAGSAAPPATGTPLLAGPSFTLPGLPEPLAAEDVEVVRAGPAQDPAAPPGLPALVVAVAAVAVTVAGAAHVTELRARRVRIRR